MPPLVRVTRVEVIGDHRLRLSFEDGAVGDVSYEGREWKGVLKPLGDPQVFAEATSRPSRSTTRRARTASWRHAETGIWARLTKTRSSHSKPLARRSKRLRIAREALKRDVSRDARFGEKQERTEGPTRRLLLVRICAGVPCQTRGVVVVGSLTSGVSRSPRRSCSLAPAVVLCHAWASPWAARSV